LRLALDTVLGGKPLQRERERQSVVGFGAQSLAARAATDAPLEGHDLSHRRIVA
jgi:hypothetical protein